MKAREFGWEWNLEDDTPVNVTASVWGSDTSGTYTDPPEYREVEVSEDITESLSEEFIERMMDMALEKDDDRAEAQMERD
jgi:hypothetical protein